MLLVKDKQQVLACGLGWDEESVVEIVLELCEGFLYVVKVSRGFVWDHGEGVVGDVHDVVEVEKYIEVNFLLILDAVHLGELDSWLSLRDGEDLEIS